ETDTAKLSTKLKSLEYQISEGLVFSNKLKSFDSLNEILDKIEENKNLILDSWVDKPIVEETLSKHNISKKFFKNHFGERIFDYFIGVINKTNELGNCPVVIVMLEFFKNKNLPLEDVYTICVNLKNTFINTVIGKYGFKESLFEEATYILDKNFEGVITNYMKIVIFSDKLNQQKTQNKEIEKEELDRKKPDENYIEYVLEHDILELKDLENEIDNLVISITMTKEPNQQQFTLLGNKLSHYGSVLLTYPIFSGLGNYIVKLGEHFIKDSETLPNDLVKLSTIALFIESFLNDLIVWRKEVFENVTEDPDFLNNSFFSNIETIINVIEDNQDEANSHKEEVNFF
ncbi:MAG: hypothetical protein OIF32_01635, partial [Campylobacterales bacterium]|nr:hypothetical protein [Campylobacterales bacterium]